MRQIGRRMAVSAALPKSKKILENKLLNYQRTSIQKETSHPITEE